ncbi:tyrosine-type recombinase/integrase [Lactococcus petauri]|uniref:tyrosine-type recombinase/integrase n=1 Tax=Lactococcus petauri TaxID=1940789 RepID=UPI0038549964
MNTKKSTIKEVQKKDGTTVYKKRVYLGTDSVTGASRYTTITTSKKSKLKTIERQKVNEFEANGKTTLRKVNKFKNFGELALDWFEGYRTAVTENSAETMWSSFNVYILPALGKYKLEKITTPLIQSIINKWVQNTNVAVKGKRSRPTGYAKNVKLNLGTIRRILQHGFELGVIKDNPALMVSVGKLKEEPSDTLKYFDADNLKKFFFYLNSLADVYVNRWDTTLYMFLIATGLRVNEALALTWDDFDFDKGIVSIRKTMTRKVNLQEKTKSQSSMREIPLDEITLAMMLAFKNRTTTEFMGKNIYNIEVVFPSNVGGHRARANCMKRLKKHYQNAGVPDIGFHGFRHTQSSILLNAGADYKEIQHRLGHSSIKITLDTYSHLAPDKAKETARIGQESLKKLGFGS